MGMAGRGDLTVLALLVASPALRPQVWESVVEYPPPSSACACGQEATALMVSLYLPPMGKFQQII